MNQERKKIRRGEASGDDVSWAFGLCCWSSTHQNQPSLSQMDLLLDAMLDDEDDDNDHRLCDGNHYFQDNSLLFFPLIPSEK